MRPGRRGRRGTWRGPDGGTGRRRGRSGRVRPRRRRDRRSRVARGRRQRGARRRHQGRRRCGRARRRGRRRRRRPGSPPRGARPAPSAPSASWSGASAGLSLGSLSAPLSGWPSPQPGRRGSSSSPAWSGSPSPSGSESGSSARRSGATSGLDRRPRRSDFSCRLGASSPPRRLRGPAGAAAGAGRRRLGGTPDVARAPRRRRARDGATVGAPWRQSPGTVHSPSAAAQATWRLDCRQSASARRRRARPVEAHATVVRPTCEARTQTTTRRHGLSKVPRLQCSRCDETTSRPRPRARHGPFPRALPRACDGPLATSCPHGNDSPAVVPAVPERPRAWTCKAGRLVKPSPSIQHVDSLCVVRRLSPLPSPPCPHRSPSTQRASRPFHACSTCRPGAARPSLARPVPATSCLPASQLHASPRPLACSTARRLDGSWAQRTASTRSHAAPAPTQIQKVFLFFLGLTATTASSVVSV